MKSAMYDEFRNVYKDEFSCTKYFIVNDGYLLYAVRWNKDTCKSYLGICMQYVNYLKINFI